MADIIPFPAAEPAEPDAPCTVGVLTDAYLRVARAKYADHDEVLISEDEPLVAPDEQRGGAWVEAWVWVPGDGEKAG